MRFFKKKIFIILFYCITLFSTSSKGDMFGGDIVYLAQILANAIEQLAQVKMLLGSSQDTLGLLQEVNRGINDSLQLLKTVYPNVDPGLFRDWNTVSRAIAGMNDVYGVVTNSKESTVQSNSDQNVAEVLALNNSIFEYSKEIDEIGEAIKDASHEVSPGGAAKLTAQTLGVMLHVLNQTLRTQSTELKLQAQSLAVQNKKDKDETREFLNDARVIKDALKNQQATFERPRF